MKRLLRLLVVLALAAGASLLVYRFLRRRSQAQPEQPAEPSPPAGWTSEAAIVEPEPAVSAEAEQAIAEAEAIVAPVAEETSAPLLPPTPAAPIAQEAEPTGWWAAEMRVEEDHPRPVDITPAATPSAPPPEEPPTKPDDRWWGDVRTEEAPELTRDLELQPEGAWAEWERTGPAAASTPGAAEDDDLTAMFSTPLDSGEAPPAAQLDVVTAEFNRLATEGDILAREEEMLESFAATPPVDEVELPPALEQALAEMSAGEATTGGGRSAESYLDEGNVYFNVGQYGLAVERYTRALDLNPRLVAAYYNRANARTRAGEYGPALADYDAALGLQPRDADALNNRGMLHLYQGSYTEAISDFEAALAIEPGDGTVLVNRGLAYLHSGEPRRALEDFAAATRIDPADAAAYYGAGQAAAQAGDRHGAIGYLRRALALDAGYAREASADPKLEPIQGEPEFLRLLRESAARAEP